MDIQGDHTPRVLIKGGNGQYSTENWVATTSPITGTDDIMCCRSGHLSWATRISTTAAEPGMGARRQDAVLSSRTGDDGRGRRGDNPSTWPKPERLFKVRISSTSGRRTSTSRATAAS